MKSHYPMSSSAPLSLPTKTLAGTPNGLSTPHLTAVSPNKCPSRDLAWHIAPDLLTSFRYAWAGVRYAYLTQRNFRIHTFVGGAVIVAGASLGLTPIALAVLVITSALVMIFELLNTALESVVDLTVGQSYHELAKIAKDCAAGAVLISAIAAVLVGGCLLVPPILTLLF